jgi:penicillin-binding protein 1A
MVVRHPHRFVTLMVALSIAFWFAMGATALVAHQVFQEVPDKSSIGRVTQMARASIFYDHLNRPAFTISKEQRIEVPLNAMSPHLRHAILAIEDQRFYEHSGVDIIRVGGAALVNLREQRAAQGASTITQQLARMSFLTLEKTFTRKVQEVLLAALVENEYSKDQILELYLNKVYFGAGLYGAEAAALGYFGKHASELTLEEASMLAGLVKAPSNYAPTVNMDRAVARRAVVLQAMREMGVIGADEAERAKTAKVRLSDALRKEEPYGRFFKEHVRHELIERFGEERVYEGGLRVFTTLDLDMQRAADFEVQRILKDLDKRRRPKGDVAALQASLVAIDPRTGEVRALIGGRDFVQSNYNRATQAKRQPGSAFKPFVYAAALEAGYTPASVIANLNAPISTPQGAWVPEDDHSSGSAMTMRSALKTSSNRAAVHMLADLGVRKAVDYAARVGIASMPAVPSLALGSGEVTLEALTSAYAVFASGGVRRTPIYIKRVEDVAGEVLYTAPEQSEQTITPQTAFLMSHMLADVVNHGTAYRARQLGFKHPAAGKTGTTNDYRDAWFVGYTPRIVTGVWVGFDQPQTIMGRGYASEVAVPLWTAFMRKATAKDPADWYKAPKGIVPAEVCRLSGKRPTEACYGSTVWNDDGSYSNASTVYTELFVAGTEPEDYCPVHGRYFGRMAGGWPITDTPSPSAPMQYPASGPVVDARDDARRADIRSDDDDDDRDDRQVAPAAQEKKRGFWSRVFGVGDDKNKEKDAEKRAREQQREQQRELERERKRQRELERELQREREKREKEEKKRRRNQQ